VTALFDVTTLPARVFTHVDQDSVSGKWIRFERVGLSASGKTEQWMVRGGEDRMIATIQWYAPWRCYALEPARCTVFEARCLREISLFLRLMTRAHRQRKATA
jgi:hypothetical protein